MSANLEKRLRKSLGNEALERRIAELEAKVAELQANLMPDAFIRSGGEFEGEPLTTPQPKKRKPRTKTSAIE